MKLTIVGITTLTLGLGSGLVETPAVSVPEKIEQTAEKLELEAARALDRIEYEMLHRDGFMYYTR